MGNKWLVAVTAGFLSLSVLSFAAPAAPSTATPANKPASPTVPETVPGVDTADELEADAADAAAGSSTAATVQAAPTVNAIGVLELRPGYYPQGDLKDKVATDNFVEVGGKITPNIALTYTQQFVTNLYDSAPGPSKGLDLKATDGYFRAVFSNLWVSPDETLTFGYQPRVYLPTDAGKRDAGMISTVRNYLTFTKKFSDTFSFQFSEIPIFHFFSREGNVVGGKAVANPAFENRIYAIPIINLSSSWSLALPVMFHQTRHRPFAGAAHSQGWSFYLWTWPELLYAIDNHHTVGIAYQSDNLVKPDLSAFDIGGGFGNGAFQLVYRASL